MDDVLLLLSVIDDVCESTLFLNVLLLFPFDDLVTSSLIFVDLVIIILIIYLYMLFNNCCDYIFSRGLLTVFSH